MRRSTFRVPLDRRRTLSLSSSCLKSFTQTCSKLWMLRFACIRCIWRMDVLMNDSIRTRILRHVHNALSATSLLTCHSAMTTQRVLRRAISSISIRPVAGTLRPLDDWSSIRQTHTKDMIRSSRWLPPVLLCNLSTATGDDVPIKSLKTETPDSTRFAASIS